MDIGESILETVGNIKLTEKEIVITKDMWVANAENVFECQINHGLESRRLRYSVTDLEGNLVSSGIDAGDENNLTIYIDENIDIKLKITVINQNLLK
ncbi:MAG: hypothetical protein RSC24_06285 [Clostridium sp.]